MKNSINMLSIWKWRRRYGGKTTPCCQ